MGGYSWACTKVGRQNLPTRWILNIPLTQVSFVSRSDSAKTELSWNEVYTYVNEMVKKYTKYDGALLSQAEHSCWTSGHGRPSGQKHRAQGSVLSSEGQVPQAPLVGAVCLAPLWDSELSARDSLPIRVSQIRKQANQ